MSAERQRLRLPNRRLCESFDIQVANLSYKVSVGRFANKDLAEIFISNHRSNSSADVVGSLCCWVLDKILAEQGDK